MTPERWQQVSALFQQALDAAPAERARLLANATTGDPELLREVLSLLETHGTAGDFLEEPAWGVAADLILEEDVLTGRVIGPYRVGEEIGRGGMGIVYSAMDERLGRRVALKALSPEWAADPHRRARLTREARAAAALSHPAIATVYALEELDGDLYLVAELVHGPTLRAELAGGPLAPDVLRTTLCDLAGALAAAHAQGIVHRDLKPENIVRRSDGQIKILDFGIALSTTDPNPRLTRAGLPLGTPGYMAPEQAAGLEADARSDIFAFGVLAWELATGRHPFRIGEPGPGATVGPPVLDAIIRRCLQSRPEDRYPRAADLLEDLGALDRPAGTPPAARALWWWRFHQAAVSALGAAAPIAAWIARASIGRPYGSWLFYSVLVLATVSVTLRLNLLFTSNVHPGSLHGQRVRVFPAIAIADTLLAAALAGGAALLAGLRDELGAVLLILSIVLLASLAMVEPATTRAAGLTSRDRAGAEGGPAAP